MKCLFCEFASGKRREHVNGYPFDTLYKTQNTLSFLSVDLPEKEDIHLLVICKKHYTRFNDMPKQILHEMIDHINIITKILRKNHEDFNILVNDGKGAGQRIMHVHFHIIPRKNGDRIKIKVWSRKKITESEFKNLNAKFKSLMNN